MHEYNDEIIEPTCTKKGYTIKTCSLCNYRIKVDYVSALGHQYVDEIINPTCLKGGYTIHTCTICGNEKKDTYTDPSGHIYGDSNVVNKDGKYYLESLCTTCDYKKSNEISHDFTKLYGYNDLKSYNNPNYLDFYYDILEACNEYKSSTSDLDTTSILVGSSYNDYYIIDEINFSDYGLTTNEAVTVWKVFGLDNPQYYWLSKEILYSSDKLMIICDDDYVLYSDRLEADTLLNNYVSELNEYINSYMSEYQIAKTIHDYIANSCKYAYIDGTTTIITEDWAHSLIGIVEEGKVVCEGYAKMYTYLASLYNLECFTVLGTADGVGHAWNYVNIDDKYYPVDLTWDDADTKIRYDYFLISKSEFSKMHIAYPSGGIFGIDYLYKLPTLSLFGYSLF
jgi:hypothetical protein